MTQSDIPDIEKIKASLEKHLKNNAIRKSEEFVKAGNKPGGMSAGYVGKDGEHKEFLIKTAMKKPRAFSREEDDLIDLTTEYIYGKIYKRFLYDRAPTIGLVTLGSELVKDETTKIVSLAKDSQQTQVALRSKFFDNFQTLSEFSGLTDWRNGELNKDALQLQQLEGFEKVIAASVFCGEIDYHASNLGVVKGENGDNIVVKIDHGKSGVFTDPEFNVDNIILSMQGKFSKFKYWNINFDAGKFNEAIKEMVKISDQEIENLVLRGLSELHKLGVDLTKAHLPDFATELKKQREAMQECSSRLDIIIRFDPPVPGGLQEDIAQNPVKWAEKYDRKINSLEIPPPPKNMDKLRTVASRAYQIVKSATQSTVLRPVVRQAVSTRSNLEK
jgi:hypothetical protein